jgi:fibronectin type 3 domain-containing protein
VTFTPQTSGAASAGASFVSNATNSTTLVSLTGSGTLPPQHSVNLSWNPSTSGAVGYNVYRGNTSGGPYAEINPTLDSSTTYTDSTVLGGKTYYYVSTALDASSVESGFSNEVKATIPAP